MIIACVGEKGGAGKSTIASNLCAMRQASVGDVLLVDTDRQATSSFWASTREDNNVSPRVTSIQKFDKAVRTEVVELSKKYQEIIIDAGGRDSVEMRASLLICDTAIFPLRPSQFDLWTLARVNILISQALEINEKLKAYVLVNQAPTNAGSKEVEEMKQFLEEFENIQLLSTVVCERVSFRRAALAGLSVVEYKPEDVKACAEMNSLYKEIYG